MLEIPETTTIAKQLEKQIMNNKIIDVITNSSAHKFAFFYGDHSTYRSNLINKKVSKIIYRSFYVEIEIDDYTLLFRDGTNIRYHSNKNDIPKKHQLLIEFMDHTYLSISVAMYGFISCFKSNTYTDKYYEIEKNNISPLSLDFTFDYFCKLINDKTAKLSSKAFIATEQRISGIGNGVTQDILYNAKINPKRKMNTLSNEEHEKLYTSIKKTLFDMANKGGRDTETDLYGNNGGYECKMSKKTANKACMVCNAIVIKENYLGGSIYYCPNCQKL